jgi:hypothetical protein
VQKLHLLVVTNFFGTRRIIYYWKHVLRAF